MKKKNQFQFLVATILLLVFSTSCIMNVDGVVGKGTVVSQIIEVQNFNSIKLMSSANVEIYKGRELKLTLSDYENILAYWNIEVINNCLIVKTIPFSPLLNSRAKVVIEMPEALYSATLVGSGDVEIKDAFNDLNEILISGSGNFSATKNGHYNNLKITISGYGNLNVNGTVENLNAIVYGSGNMHLNNLISKDADCSIYGSGKMYVNVERKLKATITGSGDIIYAGNPVIDIQDSGSGSLKPQ